jgi:hypothetical protein
MEVERFKHRQLAPTMGPSSRSSAKLKDLFSKSIYSTRSKVIEYQSEADAGDQPGDH